MSKNRNQTNGDVDAILYNERDLYRVSYCIADGRSEYCAYQKYVPMEAGKEGWQGLRRDVEP